MKATDPRFLPLCAAIGFIACALGLWINAKTMLASYLSVWIAIGAIPIGALAVLQISYLVKAGWTRDLHPPLTGAALTIPATGLLFIPVLLGMAEIYPWASGHEALPAFKAAYLTPWFFALRAVIYFTIWTALTVWAVRSYGNGPPMIRAASGGLIVWALTVSWAGIDWLESLEPHFHSSIYGLLAISFDLLGGLAFGITVVLALSRSHRMANASYGAVLLSTILLWAYLHAMQYIIIWTGNIPEEVVWYLERLAGGWGVALWAMFIGQFFLPFFALLPEAWRSSRIILLWLAGATLACRLLEAIVLVLPPLHVNGFAALLDLPAAFVAIGASWLLAWRAVGALEEWLRSGRTAAAR
ncbi:MAG: hypothetical protein ACR2K5_03010 [Pseudolabrys sp.]